MSTEANKAVVRRFVDDLWNRAEIASAPEVLAPGCVAHYLQGADPLAPPVPDVVGPEQFRAGYARWRRGFPDLRVTVVEMVAEGDLVTTREVFRGSHRGAFLGFPGTGREVAFSLMRRYRVVDGKIAEYWTLADHLRLYEQLGFVAPLKDLMAARRPAPSDEER